MSEKRIRKTTPKGEAIHPWLTKPDTKFNKSGVYHIRVKFLREQVADLEAEFTKMAEAAKQEAIDKADKAKVGKLKKAKVVSPVKPVLDEEGDETEYVVLNFKQNYEITLRNGETKYTKVALWDGKLKPTKRAPWSGSVVRVVYEPFVYYNAKDNEFGVSLRLVGVQIIKLVEGGVGADPTSFGLEAEEDAWSDEGEDKPDTDDDTDDEDNEDDEASDEEDGESDEDEAPKRAAKSSGKKRNGDF